MHDPQLKPFNGEASSKVVRRSERSTEVQVMFPMAIKRYSTKWQAGMESRLEGKQNLPARGLPSRIRKALKS